MSARLSQAGAQCGERQAQQRLLKADTSSGGDESGMKLHSMNLAPTTAVNFASATGPHVRIPYALRRVPPDRLASVGSCPANPQPGDIVLVCVERIGKNTRLELSNGRASTLHERDLLLAVFGNRYATEQFEGYARADGDCCARLSMGGVCGKVASRHASVPEPTRLRIVGSVVDRVGVPLRLRDFALPRAVRASRPRVTVVCGTAMDAGKTYTAMSLIKGLVKRERRVAGIKLTGTATGRDTWSFYDAGARPALDFVDGGIPSTYMCDETVLLNLYALLLGHAAASGAAEVVLEIADGLFQRETAILLRTAAFMATVDRLVFAASDPLGAAAGIDRLRDWGIEPAAVSGLISMSPLAMEEAATATGVCCLTAADLQGTNSEVGLATL